MKIIISIIGDAPAQSVYGLMKVLDRIREGAPSLANRKKFQRLVSQQMTV